MNVLRDIISLPVDRKPKTYNVKLEILKIGQELRLHDEVKIDT